MTPVHTHPSPRLPRPNNGSLTGAWLGLFAMLMIFIGPLIAQIQPMSPPHRSGMMTDMPMSMATDDGHLVGHPALWERCGYCDLLFHSPALGHSPIDFVAASFHHLSVPTPATLRGHARPVALFIAGPRAPPADALA